MIMATLHCIAFFLACVFLLQEIQAQSFKSYELKEEYDKSSSSQQDGESLKREVKELEEQTGAVMAEVCEPQKLLGVTCEVAEVGRRFFGSIFSTVKRFIHTPVRVLYGVVYVSGKIAKCIGKTVLAIPRKLINFLPSCLREAFNAITSFLKIVLQKISSILKSVFSFAKRLASCTLSPIRCAKDIFENIKLTAFTILKNVIIDSTEIARRTFALVKDPTCPRQDPTKDPALIMVQCGQCIFCTFKPDTSVCGNQ